MEAEDRCLSTPSSGGSEGREVQLLIVLGTKATMAGCRVKYTLATKLVNERVEAADEMNGRRLSSLSLVWRRPHRAAQRGQ